MIAIGFYMKLHTQLKQARTASKSHLKIALVHFSYKTTLKKGNHCHSRQLLPDSSPNRGLTQRRKM
jgi:hypothetical protein